MLKKLLNAVGTRGENFLREDGFFFVTLLILNTPIISFAEDFQVGFVKFYLGAFAIFFIAAAINFLFRSLPHVKKVIQGVVIISFALHFVTDIFLLHRFGVLMNQEVVQILLATNFAEARDFLREQVLNVKIIFGVIFFVLMMSAMIFGLKKFFATRTPERLKKSFLELLTIFFLPIIFLRMYHWDALPKMFCSSRKIIRHRAEKKFSPKWTGNLRPKKFLPTNPIFRS
ncbi:MAG: DUF1705 domain-containing protein [Selenomonadaceae bacterium]|nr:DUF1705 domain-containing protein [Selenomonadaceae bacterium]